MIDYFKRLLMRCYFRVTTVDSFPAGTRVFDFPNRKVLIEIKILWKKYRIGIK